MLQTTGDNSEFKNSLATLLQKNKPQRQKTIIKEEVEEEKEKIKFNIFNQEDDDESPTKIGGQAPVLNNVSIEYVNKCIIGS